MTDVRKDPRFPVDFGSSFAGDLVAGQGTVANLSLGGCSITSTARPTADSRLALRIQLPDSRWPLEVEQARVRWTRERTFGVAFEQISRADMERLRRLIHDLEQGPLVVMRRASA